MAFEVADIEAELSRLKSEGYQLIDEVPRSGFGGHLIAFIHPKSTMGSLMELVQA
jgi:methylmalonyl-CoA/ethylmalonyl-CoA epimerase